MVRFGRKYILIFFFSALIFSAGTTGTGEEIPKASLPVLSTSAGQSADVTTLNIILEEAGISYDYCDVPTADILKDGVGLGERESAEGFHVESTTDREKFPSGTPFKTVIFAIGASLKGMGASGLTVEDEVKRLKSLIDTCRKNGIFIIGVHIGGTSKRGASGSDNEKMIDAVAPYADYLIVTKDSNQDGRFTSIATEKSISLTEVEYALGVVDVLKSVFD